MTIEQLVEKLYSTDNAAGCAAMEVLREQCAQSAELYPYFDRLTGLLKETSSLRRNRGLILIAACAPWDTEDKLKKVLPEYLSHITDPKPITARQCIGSLPQIAGAKPALAPMIRKALLAADFSRYNDSMRPLLTRDTAAALAEIGGEP